MVGSAPLALMEDTLDTLPDAYATESRALAGEAVTRLITNVETVVHGRRAAVEMRVAGILSGGHVLTGRAGQRQDHARACRRKVCRGHVSADPGHR